MGDNEQRDKSGGSFLLRSPLAAARWISPTIFAPSGRYTGDGHVYVVEFSGAGDEAANEADAEAQAGPAAEEHHPKEQVVGESWCLRQGCPHPQREAHVRIRGASAAADFTQHLGKRRDWPLLRFLRLLGCGVQQAVCCFEEHQRPEVAPHAVAARPHKGATPLARAR